MKKATRNSSNDKVKPAVARKHIAATKEEKAVRVQIERVSKNARRRARNNDADIVIIRNGKIILISAKSEKEIGSVKKASVTIDVNKPVRIK